MSDPLLRHFRMLARYNALAYRRLYEACARLGDAERKKERPAFFGSIHGPLNRVLVGDRIWLARFGGEKHLPPASTRCSTRTSTSYGAPGNTKTNA